MQMSSTNSSTVNNVFTVFAPGNGGNHIANLISTDKNLTSRFNIEDYKDTTNKAHYFDNNVLSKDNIDIKETVSKNRSYGTHFFEYSGFGFAKLIKKKFVIITMPEERSKGYNRMSQLYPAFKDSYFYYEMKSLYTKENFIKCFHIDDEIISINGDELFEGKHFITHLLDETKKLGLSLDKQLCNQAHSLWLSKI